MNNKKVEHLSVLSNLEKYAFYEIPDFDDEQRLTYFVFDDLELALILKCPSPHSQIYCALQIGYFKAKKAFFQFTLKVVCQADVSFILSRYFQSKDLEQFTITKHEYYSQREEICRLFRYRLWSKDLLSQLHDHAQYITRRDITPNFIAHGLLTYLQDNKIVRPGYTTLQTVVSQALATERHRLKSCLQDLMTANQRKCLDQLLVNDTTLSELAVLKQDARNFSSKMMRFERKKHEVLKPLYEIAKIVLPRLGISKQNMAYYGSLAHHYTCYDLDRFDDEQRHLYLLCYVFKRYQQLNDNLMEAFEFHIKKLEDGVKEKVDKLLVDPQDDTNQQVGRLVLMYVDDTLSDSLAFGVIRKKAFKILSKDSIRAIGQKLSKKKKHKQDLQWTVRDKMSSHYRHHLRPLFKKIEFSTLLQNNPLLESIKWIKGIFSKNKNLSKRLLKQCPRAFISKRLSPYILTTGEKPAIKANRYEILVYKQILKQMTTGALYIDDSIHRRSFIHELASSKEKEELLKTLDIRWFKTPCEKQVDTLIKELDALWIAFNSQLKQGNLKHLKYNFEKKEIVWVRPRVTYKNDQEEKQAFYDKLPLCDIIDVLRFVNKRCGFLSSFTPLQPRYNKQKIDEDHLVAILISQAMNIGLYKMAQTSDIPYHILEGAYQQYLRLPTLKKSNDVISNAIERLSIFPHYALDPEILYGSVDGQKFEVETPTIKARYSRKYFGKGQGVVAYTLLSNHIPLQCELIGANEHESHFVFDIWYNNTSNIDPDVITGDMHSINKANFALMYWFDGELRPRFTNLKKELGHVFCGKDISYYQKFLVKPAGQINKSLIRDEKEIINQVIATLALKEMKQSTLVRKLCALPPQNSIRRAIFEFDKLIRSIYTLKCILDPTILLQVHRSQNRIESYHALRAAISRVGGRKALLGRTDLDVEISNQCGRLIATSIHYYNAAIHSHVLEKGPGSYKQRLKRLKKVSPTAKQHIHFGGHYTFYNDGVSIDLDKMLEEIDI